MKHDIRDAALAPDGRRRIDWAENDMPVLREVRARFEKEKPLRGLRMSACLHMTAETANLARTLVAGGADLVCCASNPLSTQDDVVASMVRDFEIPVFAICGEDSGTYYNHIRAAVAHRPNVTMDDGADLVTEILQKAPDLAGGIIASMEETTTGVIRLRAMERDGALRFPVIAVNDATTKHLFDNRYGTGQSTVDGIIRATDVLLAGKVFVVAGYGWCGRGVAMRARGLGARVIIAEIEPIRALEAVMDGFQVMPLMEAARIGEVFCTLTGNKHVLARQHFAVMRDGAIVCNSGHFNIEIDLAGLEAGSRSVRKGVRRFVDEFVQQDNRRIFVLGEGRLINLAAATGHPASVMDMSFATQALATEWAVKNRENLTVSVHRVPAEIEQWVATLKLRAMGVGIDTLTPEQQKYLAEWREGT